MLTFWTATFVQRHVWTLLPVAIVLSWTPFAIRVLPHPSRHVHGQLTYVSIRDSEVKIGFLAGYTRGEVYH